MLDWGLADDPFDPCAVSVPFDWACLQAEEEMAVLTTI